MIVSRGIDAWYYGNGIKRLPYNYMNFGQFIKIIEDNIQVDLMNESNEEGMCSICDEKEAETLCDPCNHLLVCEKCSDKLVDDNNYIAKCIMCQQEIQQITYVKSGRVRRIS